MHVDLYNKCKEAAIQMRKDAIDMSMAAGNSGAHYGGGLSLIEILAVLYLAVMKINTQDPYDDNRDRFILSKGHGVLALYTALKQVGFITDEDMKTFKTNHTFLYGHPCMNVLKGIEFSSGSLGQGLSLGVGSCIALERRGIQSAKVYVVLGDGECDEGSVWEAAASASHYNTSKLTVIIDKNMLQYDGETKNVLSMEVLEEKWRSFGWDTIVIDGHDIDAIYYALTKEHQKPLAIIANTVKGKGVSFMENNPAWHHAVLTQKQYIEALKELEVIK